MIEETQPEAAQREEGGGGEMAEEPALDISLGPARALGPLDCEAPTRRDDVHTTRVGIPGHRHLPVFIALEAWKAVLAHVGRNPDYEASGLLVGAPCAYDADSFLDIAGALPATEAVSSQHHVTINHDAWQSLLEAKDARNPAERIVGWYHSHPSMGVFLSEQDKFVHSHFFAQPWQVALVVDPVGQRWGLFGWEESALGTRGGFHLYGPSSERGTIEKYASVASQTIMSRKR